MESYDSSGDLKKYLIEVKPDEQTKPPKRPKRKTAKRMKRFLNEAETYIINRSKWESAQKFCAKRGLIWKVVTEKNLFVYEKFI